MFVELISTKAKVKDVEKLEEVLGKHVWEGIDFIQDEEGYFEVVGEKEEGKSVEHRPVALKLDQLPSREQYPDEDLWYTALWDQYYEVGADGFRALLRDLAPYLQTPLMVLAMEFDDGDCIAQVWRVQPEVDEVETLTVSTSLYRD